jgi:hypothetical protein
MTVKLAITIAAIGLSLAGANVPLVAHHAFAAEFDANKPVEFTGVVTKMEWVNPHVWIHLDVKKPDAASSSGSSRLEPLTSSSAGVSRRRHCCQGRR